MASNTDGKWKGQDPARSSSSPSRQELLGVTYYLAKDIRRILAISATCALQRFRRRYLENSDARPV